ncbi:MAG: hypothetical protein M0C28_15250 [Candidatus Moduliflexus flocculans]|nr:hypothetical protein [Candidatus Moduliflexus flocculans]
MSSVAEATRPGRRQDGRQPQSGHGRRHRHVRRLPRHRGRTRPSSPASTARTSTATSSTGTSSTLRRKAYFDDEVRSLCAWEEERFP